MDMQHTEPYGTAATTTTTEIDDLGPPDGGADATNGTPTRQRSPGAAARRAAGRASATGLGCAAAVHVLWATGSTWPRADAASLSELVVGQRHFPARAATWVVAAALGVAATAVLVTTESEPTGPAPTGGVRRALRLMTGATAAALLLRGSAGLVGSATGVWRTTGEFRRMNLRLYSPLCLALGAGAAAVLPRS